jgi:hypothetical protein
MEKQVHDPSRNVDRAPAQEKRQGNPKVDQDAKRDRHMQENVDATIEDSFPASDPPSWTAGAWTAQGDDDETDAEPASRPGAHAVEHPQERSGAARVAERNRNRSRNAPIGERNRDTSTRRQPTERSAAPGEVRIDDRGISSQREQPGLAERTPEQRNNDIGPGPRFENLDEQVLAEQDKPHLQPEHTDDRTDLPGRRSVSEGPHQAFPGAPPIEKQPRH